MAFHTGITYFTPCSIPRKLLTCLKRNDYPVELTYIRKTGQPITWNIEKGRPKHCPSTGITPIRSFFECRIIIYLLVSLELC